MDTIKKFKKDIVEKVNNFMARGELFAVNEIAANMMAGIMMMVIIVLIILCLVLNEVGVFSADKGLMRWGIIISLIIQIPIATINQLHRGEGKNLKYLLLIGMLLQCGVMNACLGHNVALIMVLPIMISTRYFDAKFTKLIMWITYAEYLVSSIVGSYLGVINLNVFRVPSGSILTVNETLRAAAEAANPGRDGYLLSYLINDVVPRFLIFAVVSAICIKIAQRGREMIDLQVEYTEKASRIETELNLANQIQTGMLPCIYPAFPELDQLELFAKNIPAKEVGGDFYDYFEIDGDRAAFVIADVSGKGVGAALFMMIAKTVIKNLLLTGLSPAKAMTKANEQLCENNEAGLFVTTWIGVYNSKTGELTFANAGHNPPLLIKKNGDRDYLKGKLGLFLAGVPGIDYQEDVIPLEKGDELFLYTDGVTEATDSQDTQYGSHRLKRIMGDIHTHSSEKQVQEVLDDVDKFVNGAEQFDDITMMAVKILEK